MTASRSAAFLRMSRLKSTRPGSRGSGWSDFCDDHKLGVSGYAADFTGVNPVVADNKQKYLDLFQRNVEMCVDIGSPNIRVDSVAAPGSIEDSDYQAAFDQLADVWRDAAEHGAEGWHPDGLGIRAGVRVQQAIEVIGHARNGGASEFLRLCSTPPTPTCARWWARGNTERRRPCRAAFPNSSTSSKGRIGAIHLIDSDGTLHGDETSTHRPFGEGFVDFETLAPKLLDVPKIEWWCIDMCFWAGSWELVEPSLRYVRGLLASHTLVG